MLEHLIKYDALLTNISDLPGGCFLVETGIAFALNKPIYAIVKKGIEYTDFYNGIATSILEYDEIEGITEKLRICANSK